MLNLYLHFLKIYTSMGYDYRLKLIFRISFFFWYIYFSKKIPYITLHFYMICWYYLFQKITS